MMAVELREDDDDGDMTGREQIRVQT